VHILAIIVIVPNTIKSIPKTETYPICLHFFWVFSFSNSFSKKKHRIYF